MLRIDKKDIPVIGALLAIPLALFLTVASLKILPPDPPEQQKSESQSEASSGQKTSVFDWFGSWAADDFIALFTLMGLVAVTIQVIAMRRANSHFSTTERAYVTLSHHPPGIRWISRSAGFFDIVVRVKNLGGTPAQIVGIVLNVEVIPRGGRRPAKPNYVFDPSDEEPSEAFLVNQDSFNYSKPFDINPVRARAVINDEAELIVFGYVDYQDKFGGRHRAGYGRRYSERLEDRSTYSSDADWEGRGNLLVIMSKEFNYDRKREWGEGSDWDA